MIHNGLDLSKLDRSENREAARKKLDVAGEDVAILLLGTVCERKGQHDLVKALSLLPEKWHNRIKCFIVGDRPSIYSNQLADLVSGLPLQLQQRVTVVSETPETAKYYKAADIFVCKSLYTSSTINSIASLIGIDADVFDANAIFSPFLKWIRNLSEFLI